MQPFPLGLQCILFLLLSLANTSPSPIPPPKNPPIPLPDTTPSDLNPLGDATTPAPPYSWPIFSLSALDTAHSATAYRRDRKCKGTPVAHIYGLPKAISSDLFGSGPSNSLPGARGSSSVDAPATGSADLMSPGYEGGAGRKGMGKGSVCIVFDLGGWGAGSIELGRVNTATPRSMAALWNNERCEGQPDDWASMKPNSLSGCNANKEGHWRSIRVWYGSERLSDAEFEDGRMSLAVQMEEQKNGQTPKKKGRTPWNLWRLGRPVV